MQADFVVTVQWDSFVTRLKELPEVTKAHANEVQAGQDLLERIQNQDLPAEYIIDIPLHAFQSAYALLDDNQTADPVTEAARFMLDTDGWEKLLSTLWKSRGQCDNSIGGEFL